MPGKPEDEASSAGKTTEPAAKSQSAEGAAKAPSAAHAPPPSLDGAIRSLLEPLAQRLARIELKLASAAAAAAEAPAPAAATSAAADAHSSSAIAPSSGGPSLDSFKGLPAQLERIEKQLGSGPAAGAGHDELVKALGGVAERQAGLGHEVIEKVTQHVSKELHAVAKFIDSRLNRMEEAIRPAAPTPISVQIKTQDEPVEADDDLWKEAILGEDLCRDSSIAEARTRLFRGVLADDDGAKSLAGQLLLAQAATPDRLPPLIKEVGEAYYRWRPKLGGSSDPLETALAAWLKRRCDAGGLGNTIELVVVGDRFDATRHNATERGAVITAVQGWVVLRDNGKVYTKANVSVK